MTAHPLGRCQVLQSFERCNGAPIPGAPFAVCYRHASDLQEFLNQVTEEAALEFSDYRLRSRPKTGPIVYYLEFDHLIKIGTTVDFKRRLLNYPPSVNVLITEPGGKDLEADRLKQFNADLMHGREWFRKSDQLLSHIENLRSAFAERVGV